MRHLRIAPSRIAVIPWGCEERFQPTGEHECFAAVRRCYHLPPRYVLFAGTLEPRKNLTTLLQAYAMLCHAWHDHELKLVVAGRAGWLYQDIFTTVKSLGLEEEVAFTGFVEESDLTALYRGAALFVYTSLHEGFGLPILEAMACGILVITSNVSSMPEVAGQAAILVEPRRPEVLAAVMASVLGDVQLRDNLRNMGLERPNNSLGRGLRAKCWRCIALA